MISKLLIKKDSATAAYRASDSIEKQENISRNMNGILQLQKERNAKEKRGAFLRIGIGISFLVLLFIGLRRRKK